MKKTIIVISLFVVLLVLASCNRLRQEKMPGIDITIEEMNNELHLSAPPELSTFIIGDDLGLVLINSSDKPIILSQDFGVHIFRSFDGNWVDVENRIDYPPGEKEVYSRENHLEREMIIVVDPSVLSEQNVTIRIVVVGNYYDESSRIKGNQVGAFIDVTLIPK
jgi:hypothetical protein